jgi:hypothetical protein
MLAMAHSAECARGGGAGGMLPRKKKLKIKMQFYAICCILRRIFSDNFVTTYGYTTHKKNISQSNIYVTK